MLAYIWAEDRKHQIGVAGHLPWQLPADLAYFKKTTAQHPIVMGRKTFASLPGVLPHRHHYVLTRSAAFADKYAENAQVTVVHTLADLRRLLATETQLIFIIGGASLFAAFADEVDYLYVTEIDAEFTADTKMPELKMADFELISATQGLVDHQNPYAHSFKVYRRK
ncbi:dihydrofolate reductase [Liquorilactobacillus satsumensis]|uniref:Dihydrofolate reductase n=1 Tax=Liquorilactobacillus satsumensis DSM 16230 = JCM 12392 TaxID=1423801 RepID=A0A0R1VCA8_9LACO|nr:dihydrofolate reductase [Liquorilactobacillus satsumensis]KRL99499.1 dihydrofolate reductase [Liquorilactobacillus satsumensis DSM 16230 = JCM 12392]MCC7665976.1 dihydrofolate reductase [Liquorilactobacillus satsumensis]MCP9312064.1 dihydrofolate reductase [Liquorilactobacillus satsumensis]MCP9327849.1 dihydrofolate reductase [Liquorilactobacillus satsumensis]MCP9356682.1 dihydrofolate reductase [Liquorilactobacillus satsumensis]